ncbi:MAG: hydroxymethylbilane synthase [Actinobacteria bacterium]|nr:hydroxymethylbilane synthase [Actinomycetota bacterium]
MNASKIDSITLGTRGSELALFQARHIAWLLQRQHVEISVKIKTITTSGDKILDAPLAKIGDKGLFVKEIENELISGEIDIAVHSCKDLPTEIPVGLMISAYGKREDARDAFISSGPARNIDAIRKGARIGTSSLRRRSQLKALRPDLDIVDIRGNVDTRIRKIKELELDGTILAAAGIRRLKRDGEAAFFFATEQMVPAVGQGVIAVESRIDDPAVRKAITCLNDANSEAAVVAERALMRELEGGCQVPIGGHAIIMDGELVLNAFLGSLDGSEFVRDRIAGPKAEAGSLGLELARRMYAAGGREILAEVRAAEENGAPPVNHP